MTSDRLQSGSAFISKYRLDGDNVELDALRALQYEGTPAEIAQGFKEQGNEVVKMKRWKDGKEFYTKGLAVLVQQKKKRVSEASQTKHEPQIPEEEADLRKEKELEEVCYVNRALCNLELSMKTNFYNIRNVGVLLIRGRKLQIYHPRLRISPSHQSSKR